MEKLNSPRIDSSLRHNILRMPREVYSASGIVINGRRIKSFVFTTDLAIIRNCDADAVLAVYPFTPQQCISDARIKASYIPVFCGVGAGTTKRPRTVRLAKHAAMARLVWCLTPRFLTPTGRKWQRLWIYPS